MLVAVAAALLVSTGFALANDIVPGSDTYVRDQQSAADASVVAGTGNTRTAYGYPVSGETLRQSASASDRADDRAVDRTAGAVTTAPRGAMVPGSDSF